MKTGTSDQGAADSCVTIRIFRSKNVQRPPDEEWLGFGWRLATRRIVAPNHALGRHGRVSMWSADGKRFHGVATVGSRRPDSDVAILIPTSEPPCRIFDVLREPETGEEIWMEPLGRVGRVSSLYFRSGQVPLADTCLTGRFVLGVLDLEVRKGDSGAPVIARQDGALIGMVVGRRAISGQAVFLGGPSFRTTLDTVRRYPFVDPAHRA